LQFQLLLLLLLAGAYPPSLEQLVTGLQVLFLSACVLLLEN
jgi:hypothetical protein